jgi:predicted metalloprotease with PDZ domain
MIRGTRIALCGLFTLVATLCLAEIRYTVTPLPEQGRVRVAMELEAKAGTLLLQMPNWAPGAYILTVPGKNVQDFQVKGPDGAAIPSEKVGDDTWKAAVPSGKVVAEYTVPCAYTAGAMHYSGPSTYLYAVGRKEEACRLDLKTPDDWKVAVGLDADGASKTAYVAPDYDVLADNPVSMGDFIELTYTVANKPHIIAMRGAPRAQVDQKKILDVCKHVTESQADFFGGLPYSKYVWHFNVIPGADGGGGLEHLSSTQITLAAGVGPGSVRVISHEFFHLWNVKRIRSEVLGPFDYTQLPKTGALYWLEGVTDYYASLLLLRCGWMDEAAFHRDLINNLNAVRNNPARMEVSAYESSMRVGEANNGRGNSSGYRINYYSLGWIVGMLLDIEMRSATNGRRSLDDVTRALWELCKVPNKPGFEEGEIRKQLVRFGGARLGAFFDQVVMQPGEQPVEAQLDKVGLKLTNDPESYLDPTFDFGPVFGGGTLARVTAVRGSAQAAGLQANDLILEIGGTSVQGASVGETMSKVNTAVSKLKAGSAATVKVRRGEVEQEFSVTPVTATRTRWRIAEAAAGDRKKLDLRNGWYYAGKRRPT